MKILFIFNFSKKAIFILTLLMIIRCTDDEFLIEPVGEFSTTELTASTSEITATTDCSACTYVVPANTLIVDGAILGIKPGSVIGLDANIKYGALKFRNIVGTPESPIIIRNCGGVAQVDGTGYHDAFKTENSKYFRVTGGEVDGEYGIVVSGARMGVNIGGLSTNCEVDHVKIINSGFAGIMAKTDPGCDPATWRENFLMEDVDLHHNYISDSGGEGIYAGNSFFMGMNTSCGVQLPHEIHNIKIRSNILKNTGWDGIQLGCATQGAAIYDNRIENYGVANEPNQNSGLQISAGTGGLCYNNLIRIGTGNGMAVFGIGDNIIYNNIIDQAGNFGIFCDERYTPGPGFKFLNNTIINPASDGIRIYAELVPMNVIMNNIIANPGSSSKYTYPRSAQDGFVYKLNSDVKITMANNYFTTITDSLQILDLAGMDYNVASTSPVIDKGADCSAYCMIQDDFYHHARLTGAASDIGAVENVGEQPNVNPVANAGADKTITLPASEIVLEGAATDADGSIVSFKWTQYGGEKLTIANADTKTATLTNLREGKFYFRLTVVDDDGGTDYDNILVKILAPLTGPSGDAPVTENVAPVANAGPDQRIELPVNTVILHGSGTDIDGTVVQYTWTQYGGPTVSIVDANSATATMSFTQAGNYYFRLTVKDDDGATHYDNMLVAVTGTLSEETPNAPPVAYAGKDQTVTLPVSAITLAGSATDSDGSILSYSWTQYGGPAAIISNGNTPTATITGLVAGKFYFRLTVQDDDGAKDYDNVLVVVNNPL